jgi:hypothetical protein
MYPTGACPAAASDQPGEPLSADDQPTAGQMVTLKSHGTSAGLRRDADRDGVELESGTVTLQRDTV